MNGIDPFFLNLIVMLFCVFLAVTTLFSIAKIWQRGVRRDQQKRIQHINNQ